MTQVTYGLLDNLFISAFNDSSSSAVRQAQVNSNTHSYAESSGVYEISPEIVHIPASFVHVTNNF